MRHDYQEFADRDAEILAIGPEDLRAFREYWAREAIPFVGLADPAHRVADNYGQETNLLKVGRMPAILIVDKSGRVRYQHYGDSMVDIPTNAAVLAILDEIEKESGP